MVYHTYTKNTLRIKKRNKKRIISFILIKGYSNIWDDNPSTDQQL